jgi:hypothetical protein
MPAVNWSRALACLVAGLSIVLGACGLMSVPEDEPPSRARVELGGTSASGVTLVFANGPAGDDTTRPMFFRADTLDLKLPVTREFAVESTEFWLVIRRDEPHRDRLSAKVWADDFLFVNLPELPDTQRVVTIRYRHEAGR